MRYSQEYKMNCIELYRQGKWPETLDGIKERNFRGMVKKWSRMEEANDSEVLKHKNFNKNWTPEEKLELVSQVLAGKSNQTVAIKASINTGMLYQWVRKYKIYGYNGLVDKKNGRKSKNQYMKKRNIADPRKFEESEYEELIRLRAKDKYIKAEIETIKK
ncbi:helix-turn-helix domain-containing protein [[Eubacterium] hominis]|uniref:transposase n=1 Tax=[Eubacterium] hominis TaxID=2764325 RepID=UPI0022E522B3